MMKFTLWKGLLFSLMMCLITLGITELLFRLLLPFPLGTKHTYTSAPDVLYFHRPESSGYEIAAMQDFRPSHVRYNEFGFRGDSLAGVTRPIVVLMGDSFVEARQVDEKSSFPGLLSDQFNEYTFVNAGCSAYTTTTEYLLLKNRVLDIKPRKVILFFTFNDYADNFNYQGGYFRHPEIFSGELPPELRPNLGESILPRSILEIMKVHSAIVANMARWLSVKPKAELAIPPDRTLFQHTFKAVNTPTHKLDDEGRKVLEFTHRGLAEIAALAKQQGIEFSVFIIPLPTQVSSREWSPGKAVYYGYKLDEFDDSVVYQSRLKSFCTTAGIECIDLLPDFRAASSSGSVLFLPYDGHWTEEGHRVVARAVARYLGAPR
jgi:hypothetical protein